MAEVLSTGHLNTNIQNENVYGVIQVHLNLFVDIGTFPEQIAITETFSKFRSFLDCACLLRANSTRDII